MSNGAIVDVTVRILRRRWAVLLGLAVLFVGPGALLTAAASMRFNDVVTDVFLAADGTTLDLEADVTQAEMERLLGSLGAYLGATIVAGLLASIAIVGFSAVVGADYLHRPMSLAQALRVSLRRALSALAFNVITTVIVVGLSLAALLLAALVTAVFGGALDQGGPGLFLALIVLVALVVALAYLTMRWAPALPAMANEDLGWRAAMVRSWHLSSDSLWRIFFIIVFGSIATALIALMLGLLLDAIVVDGLAGTLGLDVTVAEALSTALVSVLVAAVLPVMTAVLYFDLRTRRDPPGAVSVVSD